MPMHTSLNYDIPALPMHHIHMCLGRRKKQACHQSHASVRSNMYISSGQSSKFEYRPTMLNSASPSSYPHHSSPRRTLDQPENPKSFTMSSRTGRAKLASTCPAAKRIVRASVYRELHCLVVMLAQTFGSTPYLYGLCRTSVSTSYSHIDSCNYLPL
ncbi:uncharacterized protein EI90DRAFT_195447 [Cantharellus anzutake]|uniref:uncharacterized protein n=1 Tax=Cantharellus anzutake TaxID=1750568 RepID=UPI00190720FA|nr:uncharacterized protein EI90DRAFT_195447 [Cantharellus anzutake]KAF8336591.1 hypothetical protein EI90DRAFT_195447 [Cantharellus anzutake]